MVVVRHVALVFAVVLVPCLASAQARATAPAPATPAVDPDTEAWAAAVRAHAAGVLDAPARAIADWPQDRVTEVLGRVLGRLRRLSDRPDAASADERKALAALLTRGLSLHTDIALAEHDLLAERGAGDERGAVVLLDGRETRHVERSHHWRFARQIAAGLAGVADEAPRALAWYRAIASGLQEGGDYDVAGVHLQEARRWFADDAVLALYQGTQHQMLGDPRLREHVGKAQPGIVVRTVGPGARPPWAGASDLRQVPPSSRLHLEAAVREFRRALSADPSLHEARIRLAHVLSNLGDDRGAADTVRPALEAALSPFLEFYAALILGRSEEHLDHYAEADDAYARAAARVPAAPSPRIGRSRVALARGRAADALATLADVTTEVVADDADPWLFYLRQHDPGGGNLLGAWRVSLP